MISSMMYGYGFAGLYGIISFLFCILLIAVSTYIICTIVLSFAKKYRMWQWENEQKNNIKHDQE